MRLVAFHSALADGPPGRRLGIEKDDGVLDLTDLLGADLGAVLAGPDPVAALTDAESEAAYEGQPLLAMADVRLLAPLAHPGKIVCVGLNYYDHCREQGVEPPARPMLFAKFANAITDPGVPGRPAADDRDARPRVRAGGDHRLAGVTGVGGPCHGPCLRLHDPQRRHRPRPPARGPTVAAGQGLRRLRAARAGGRDPRPDRRPGQPGHPILGQRRDVAGLEHRRHDLGRCRP